MMIGLFYIIYLLIWVFLLAAFVHHWLAMRRINQRIARAQQRRDEALRKMKEV